MTTELKILGPGGHETLLLEGQALIEKAQELVEDNRYALFGDGEGPIAVELVPQFAEIIAVPAIAGG